MRIGDYINFLRKVGRDKRFNADTLLAAINQRFPGRLSFPERVLYRYAVIPRDEGARSRSSTVTSHGSTAGPRTGPGEWTRSIP